MGLTKPRAAQIYNLDYKQSTRVVTVANVTLSGGAPAQVDGVSLSLNDRVLVTGQSTGSQNGLYYVTTVGSGSNGTWARTTDGNETGEIEAGMIVMVTEGTIYADTQWKLTTNDPITIGSTALTFTQNYSANSISSGTSNVVVNSNANVTISSAGTANVLTISSTGTVTTGTASVTGNVTGGNILTSGLISATGNVTGGNVLTGGSISATSNITGGNLLTGGLISAAGNVTGNYFLGNVFYANGITASKIYNGTSEVNVVSSGGNVNVSIGGTSNVVVLASTGEYVTGVLSVSSNVTGGNILTAGLISSTGNITGGNLSGTSIVGTLTTAAQTNITSVGTLSALTVTANVTGGNIRTTGQVSATANITGGNVLTGGQVSATGNVTSASLIGNVYSPAQVIINAAGQTEGGQLVMAWANVGNLTGQGNGSWNIDVDTSNTLRTFYQNTTGSTNVVFALNSTTQTANFSGNIGATYYYGNGAFLTGISGGSGGGSNIANGATNISIPVSSGNITMSVAGASNTVVINLGSLTMYGTFAGPKTLNANVTVANAVNAVIFGPVTIADGFNITIPNASVLYTYSGA